MSNKNIQMTELTKETTEALFSTILGRKFMPEVDAAQALLVSNIIESYARQMSHDYKYIVGSDYTNVRVFKGSPAPDEISRDAEYTGDKKQNNDEL